MSIDSPPRRPGQRDHDDHPHDDGGSDGYSDGWAGRVYSSAMAPFRVRDGGGRLRGLLIGALVIFTIFGARLIDLQAIHADQLAAEARGGRTITVNLPAQRGTIYDASGAPLAETVPARNITVDPYLVDNPADYARKLAPVVGLSEETILKSLTRRVNSSGTQVKFAYVARQVPLDVWQKILDLKLPGTYSETTALRYYPNGALAANVLGSTDYEGKGVNGLEGMLEGQLAGTAGKRVYEQSGTGAEIPTGTENTVEATAGNSYTLTIDRDLQYIAQQAIVQRAKEVKAINSVVIAMDARTGKILAMAQSPTSDPNSRDAKPEGFQNLAVTQAFEPGSTAKVMSLAAVVEEGKGNAETVFKVPNILPRGGFPFKDDVSHVTYYMTMAGVLAQSSNIGTIQAAELIGKEKLYEYEKKFGVGEANGLGFPAAQAGYLPALSQWNDVLFPNISYGQGLSMNALQVMGVYCALANDGVRVSPTLVQSMTRTDGTVENAPEPTATRVVSADTASQIRLMMEQVVSDSGTGKFAAIDGYRVAGKTGTAQIYETDKNGKNGTYNTGKFEASFVGLAPADNPRIVVGVMTKTSPQSPTHFGGEISTPVFTKVMSAALNMYKIPPSGTKAPVMELHTEKSPKVGPWNAPRR